MAHSASYPNCKTVHRRFQMAATRFCVGFTSNELAKRRTMKKNAYMLVRPVAGQKLRCGSHGFHLRQYRNHVRLVQLCFDFYMIEAKPENLISDRAYDSDPLDEGNDGIEMIAPHRSNRSKPPTDRRRLSVTCDVGSSSASLPGSSGSTVSLFVGSTTLRTSWALYSSPASLSSSGDFETSSSQGKQNEYWICRSRRHGTSYLASLDRGKISTDCLESQPG